MKVQSGTEKYQKTPKTEVTITKKAKVSFFRPTVLHDHAASRLVKTGSIKQQHLYFTRHSWLPDIVIMNCCAIFELVLIKAFRRYPYRQGGNYKTCFYRKISINLKNQQKCSRNYINSKNSEFQFFNQVPSYNTSFFSFRNGPFEAIKSHFCHNNHQVKKSDRFLLTQRTFCWFQFS